MSLSEGKNYFSGNHKACGYKMDVSVLPNGVAIGCTVHNPASISDIDKFQKNLAFHKEQLDEMLSVYSVLHIGPLKNCLAMFGLFWEIKDTKDVVKWFA